MPASAYSPQEAKPHHRRPIRAYRNPTDLDDKTELLPICTCNICVILQYLCLCGFVTDSRPRPEFFTVERMPCTGSSLPHTVEVALGCTEVSVVDISIIIIPQAAGRKQK